MSKKIIAQLTGPMDLVINYLIENPGGGKAEDIAKSTGLTESKVKRVMSHIKMHLVNVRLKKIGEVYRVVYNEIEPDQKIIVTTTTGGKKPEPGKKDGPQVSIGKGTDIVWARPPEVPDPLEKYSWFEEPHYFKHFKNKVLLHGKSCKFQGPPGVGKSSAVEYLSCLEMRPMVNINADAGLKAKQLVGGMTDLGRFEVAQFATAVVKGWWAKIDEANGADPDAIITLNSILAPPNMITIAGVNYPVHPEFRLFITYNAGLIGTKPLPDSLKDRFYPFIIPFPTEPQLLKMLSSNKVDIKRPEALSLVKIAMALSEKRKGRLIRFDITMRRLLDAWSDVLDGIKVKDAAYNTILYAVDDMQDQLTISQVIDECLKVPDAKV